MRVVKLQSDLDPFGYYPQEIQTGADEYLEHNRLRRRLPVWRPPTDVYETQEAVVVRVEIAGMRETDFDIMLNNRQLVIRGVRNEASERRAYHQMEIRFGEFRSEVELPHPVELDQIKAVYNNGFLTIMMPIAQPHRVQIEE